MIDQLPYKTGSNVDKAQEFLDRIKREKLPYLKLEGGQNSFISSYLRICPEHQNMDGWFTGISVHFGVGATKRTVACRREMLDDFCPVCEKAFELYNGGHEKEGKDLMPSWRSYMNVVRLNQDGTLAEDKIYIWSVGAGLLELITEEFADKGVDLTDIETGYNFRIKRKGTGKDDTKYTLSSNGPCPFPDVKVLLGIFDCIEIVPMFDEAALESLLAGGSQRQAIAAGAAAGAPALPAPATEEEEPEAVEGEIITPPPGGFADDDPEEGDEAAVAPAAEEADPEPAEEPADEGKSETMKRLAQRVAKPKKTAKKDN